MIAIAIAIFATIVTAAAFGWLWMHLYTTREVWWVVYSSPAGEYISDIPMTKQTALSILKERSDAVKIEKISPPFARAIYKKI